MTYTPRIPLGSKYSLYNADGNGKNPLWDGSLIKMLTALVADVDQPAEERERASIALKFYVDRVAVEGDQLSEVYLGVAKMFGIHGAHMLWDDPEDCLVGTKTGEDGITRTHILSKKYHGPEAFRTPAALEPAPSPSSPYAVPLPVIPPSDTELAAREYMERRYANAANVQTERVGPRVTPPVRTPTTVEQIESEIAHDKTVRDQYEAALTEVARLRALLG